MERQGWEEFERRRKQVRRLGKGKREKKENAAVRKDMKVAMYCVFSHESWLCRVEK